MCVSNLKRERRTCGRNNVNENNEVVDGEQFYKDLRRLQRRTHCTKFFVEAVDAQKYVAAPWGSQQNQVHVAVDALAGKYKAKGTSKIL